MSIKSVMLGGVMLATLLDGGAALAQAVAVGPAAAATEAVPVADEIIVTGSRIRRDPLNQHPASRPQIAPLHTRKPVRTARYSPCKGSPLS